MNLFTRNYCNVIKQENFSDSKKSEYNITNLFKWKIFLDPKEFSIKSIRIAVSTLQKNIKAH
jgi:hypothetical protein